MMQTQTQESRGLHRISQNQKPHVQYDSNICIFSYRKINNLLDVAISRQ